MLQEQKPIAVIGSGVIGLTSAYRLLEAGFPVTVLARALPPHTTSDVAAAFWSPSATAGDQISRQWALTGLQVFTKLAENPASGIAIVDMYNITDVPTDMSYMANAGSSNAIAPGHFPAPWAGVRAVVPRIDVPIYMPWLYAQVEGMGGVIKQHIVQDLRELDDAFAAVINCSGLGAQLLAADAMFPVRGQVISVRRPADLPNDIIYANTADTTTYIIPRSQDCLLGGTYQYRDGNTEVDTTIADAILDRCALFRPSLRSAEILQHKVGLRPGRNAVRVEAEERQNGQIIVHNYGHGSIGHTLSWGCAAEVTNMIRSI